MAENVCKHCGVTILSGRTISSRGEVWFEKLEGSRTSSQYCWIDPILGSQLHEPVELDLNAEITKIWEKYDPTTFNQQSVAIAFAKEVRSIKL